MGNGHANLFQGGLGKDTATGGAGRDLYDFDAATESGVGSAALIGAGQAGFFTCGGNTIVRLSTEADAASEAEIQLTGVVALTAQDFYL